MRRISWDKKATNQLAKAISYIRERSPRAANEVKKEILQKIDELSIRPEIHPLDKYKLNNDGTYRAFEIYRYRISYLVKKEEVIVARIRHTSMKPEHY
jgi:plasmid stabilization system protein ParE